ncbi:MAG: VanW family protein [Solobacterium sp.]|nr:VanW family protein [Solobacterium sp.]
MKRKRLTEIFPALIPLRQKQRRLFWFTKMRFDGNRYAHQRSEEILPYEQYSYICTMINPDTGSDLIYQYNKAENLKIASAPVNGTLIHPGETFSLCLAIRDADRRTPYKEALIVVNDRLTAAKGGGLCQLSNMLYWTFLNSPLTVTERHPHRMRDFPDPTMKLLGSDATIVSGWLDLKVKNTTDHTYQIVITFAGEQMCTSLRTDDPEPVRYLFRNEGTVYTRLDGHIYEDTDVLRYDTKTNTETLLYRNHTEIGYPRPEGTVIQERNRS